MRFLALFVLAVAVTSTGGAAAEEILLPGFAYTLSGQGGNLWTSEVFVTNLGPETATIRLVGFLPGRWRMSHPCVPPDEIALEVPPHVTVHWPAVHLAQILGCVEWAVGALVLESDEPVAVASRMVNERGGQSLDARDLRTGWGQELPGIPFSGLPEPRALHVLPALVWHPNPCGRVLFETHLHLVNPDHVPAWITLSASPDLSPVALRLDGKEVTTPVAIQLEPGSWQQVRVDPPESMLPVCLDPVHFDLYIEVEGPVGVYASVVDRTSQDPRTVLPLRLLFAGNS